MKDSNNCRIEGQWEQLLDQRDIGDDEVEYVPWLFEVSSQCATSLMIISIIKDHGKDVHAVDDVFQNFGRLSSLLVDRVNLITATFR